MSRSGSTRHADLPTLIRRGGCRVPRSSGSPRPAPHRLLPQPFRRFGELLVRRKSLTGGAVHSPSGAIQESQRRSANKAEQRARDAHAPRCHTLARRALEQNLAS